MDPLKTNKQTPRKTEAHEAWGKPNFYFLIISEPHSHVLSPAFWTSDDRSWQQSLKTFLAHTQVTLEGSAQSILPKKKQQNPFSPQTHQPQICHSSCPIPSCILLGCSKIQALKIYFSLLNQMQFFLLSHPANTTSRTLPWNVWWGGAKGLYPVPGRVEFLPCSGPRGFFRNLFRALGKRQSTKFSGKELGTSRGLETTEFVQFWSGPKHRAGKTLGFLGNQRWVEFAWEGPYQQNGVGKK